MIADDTAAIAQRLKEIQDERRREIAGKPDPESKTNAPVPDTTKTGEGGFTNNYGRDPHIPPGYDPCLG